MNPIKPKFDSDDFKIAVDEKVESALLAFREGSYFREEVLEELNAN